MVVRQQRAHSTPSLSLSLFLSNQKYHHLNIFQQKQRNNSSNAEKKTTIWIFFRQFLCAYFLIPNDDETNNACNDKNKRRSIVQTTGNRLYTQIRCDQPTITPRMYDDNEEKKKKKRQHSQKLCNFVGLEGGVAAKQKEIKPKEKKTQFRRTSD